MGILHEVWTNDRRNASIMLLHTLKSSVIEMRCADVLACVDDLPPTQAKRTSHSIPKSMSGLEVSARPGARTIPLYLLNRPPSYARLFCSARVLSSDAKGKPSLPHLTSSSEIHVVPISNKAPSHRIATAVASITFSTSAPLPLIRANALRKGDVLAVSRIAGVMAAKRTSDIIPLCHNGVGLEGIQVWVEPVKGLDVSASEKDMDSKNDEIAAAERTEDTNINQALRDYLKQPLGRYGGIRIAAAVSCTGKTGVEMEALCAVTGAGLSVLDMVKGVDKGCVMDGITVVKKEGGRSGTWRAEGW
jgi:molybdenum cofactor biosynthesis protein MoaC